MKYAPAGVCRLVSIKEGLAAAAPVVMNGAVEHRIDMRIEPVPAVIDDVPSMFAP